MNAQATKKQDRISTSSRFPAGALALAVTVTVLALSGLMWAVVDTYRVAGHVRELAGRVRDLRGTILQLDEGLTMSARMAAATGDTVWEERYRRDEPVLDAAIKEAIAIAPSAQESAVQIDAANVELVVMEHRALELAREGRGAEAQAILGGEAHQLQKQRYADGLAQLLEALRRYEDLVFSRLRGRAWGLLVAASAALAVLLGAWYVVWQTMRRWQRLWGEDNHQLVRQAEMLQEWAKTLDRRVAERTEELQRVRDGLQEEVDRRRRMEEALGDSERRCEALILEAPDPIVVLDRLGVVQLVNQAAEAISGYRSGELIGQHFVKIGVLTVPSALRAVQEFGLVIAGSERPPFELEMRRKDGTAFTVEAHPSLAQRSDHVVVQIIFRDITERKRVEDWLRKLERAVEQSSNVILLTDREGVIEYVNPAFTRITGYQLEEVAGKTLRVLKSGDTPLQEYERLWRTIAEGKEWRGEFRNQKKNGEFYWAWAAISPVRDASVAITHFLGVQEDITERKRAEEALKREKAELEVMNRVMTGRELRMVEMKQEVNVLLVELGRSKKYG